MKRALHVRQSTGGLITGYYASYPEILSNYAHQLTIRQAVEMKDNLIQLGVYRTELVGGGFLFVSGNVENGLGVSNG